MSPDTTHPKVNQHTAAIVWHWLHTDCIWLSELGYGRPVCVRSFPILFTFVIYYANFCAKLVTKFIPPLYNNASCMSLFDSRWTECYPIHFLEIELGREAGISVLSNGFHSYYPVLEDYWESQLTASRTMSFCCCLAAAITDLTVFIIAGSLPSPGPMTSACSRGSHEPMASLDWEHWSDLQERGGSGCKEWCRMLHATLGQCAHSNGWTISSGL